MLLNDKERKFIKLLEQEPVRLENKRACDKYSELSDEELESILLLQDTKTLEEACEKLKPLYQKYKGSSGKRQMPELVIRGIYFIIFREMCLKLTEDKKCEPQKRLMLSEDGKLRKRILPKCTNKVYQLLGESSSKPQERLGIHPLKDFTALKYEPINFHVAYLKDNLFREIFLNIIFNADYAMFIDLTGEDSVLGDIYYCDREVVCCRDSVTANFYYALQLRYRDFCKYIQLRVERMTGDVGETIDSYKKELKERNMRSIDEMKNKREYAEKLCSGDRVVVLTYPLQFEDIDLDLAVKYLLVQLDSRCRRTAQQLQEDIPMILQNQIQWLKMRIEKTIISWCSVQDILKKIDDGNVSFLHLKKESGKKGAEIVYKPDFSKPKTKHYTYYENLQDTIAREKKQLLMECKMDGLSQEEIEQRIKKYEKNKEIRIKKGFLFFDFNVRQDKKEAEFFAHFIEKNECQWAFVCDRKERYWEERLKGEKVKILEVDDKNPYANYLRVCGYRDIMIITNVNVKKIMAERIKLLLSAYDVSNTKKISRLIKIRDNIDRYYVFEGDTDE